MAFQDNYFLKRDKEIETAGRKRQRPVERQDKETQTEEKEKDTPVHIQGEYVQGELDVYEVWKEVDKSNSPPEPKIIKEDRRPGWKTVRIFVSSTFKDFHQEREILVKEVFAELRHWCEGRKLHLIDCDLRWGVPKGTDTELTVRTCLEEIDRCIEYNIDPYFINFVCKRTGLIPSKDALPASLWKQYDLPCGLSVTEMEIVHAAYRRNNPNALFLFRDESFLEEVHEEAIRKCFIDEGAKEKEKLKVLKDKIKNRFHNGFKTYNCKYIPGQSLYGNYATKEKAVGEGIPKLEIDPGLFEEVRRFFEERIELQYPVVEQEEVNDFVRFKTHHEDFMASRCRTGEGNRKDMIIGREGVLKQIDDYITKDTSGHPLLIIGDAGSGKSSIMAKAVSDALEKIESKGQPCNRSCDGWKVFFHFVGAVPKSTSLLWILRRLLKELDPSMELPETIQDTAALIRKALSTASMPPTVIFIDALNQIDKETQIESTFWLPERLSSNVRCVVSLITNSEPHRALQKRNCPQTDGESLAQDPKTNPESSTPDLKSRPEILVPDLKPTQLFNIMDNYLSHFNKKLDGEQVLLLLDKASSKNPLWLRIACEELRVYGDFRSVNDFIKGIEDGLPELLKQVLKRFEDETDCVLLEATICLLEVSKFGLLEAELLEILADKDHLDYNNQSKTESPEQSGAVGKGSRLPYAEWAGVYRNLRIFLRPYGNPNEGRLDFYHRTLSKVVQEKYLDKNKSEADYNKKRWWWHKKLAEYYRHHGTYDRKVEEYPYHLLFLRQYSADEEDQKRYSEWLQEFLVDMKAFEHLYDNEFSSDLLFYWRESGDKDYTQMCTKYVDLSKRTEANPASMCKTLEQFSRVMGQAGRYAEALQMAERCLEMLKDPSNEMEKKERDEKLISIYSNIGHIKSIISQEIRVYHEIIDMHKTAIQIIRDNKWENQTRFKKLTALQFNKIAYVCGEIYRLVGSAESLAEGLKNVELAIELYTELEDFAHELEAQLTKATLYRDSPEEQLKIYKLTRQKARQMFGKEHHLMCRLSFNTAIAHEAADDLDNAYKHFRKSYDLGLKVYGPKHASTELYRDTICEEKYALIGRRLGHTVD